MSVLDLTGQNIEKQDIVPKLLRLKNLLDQRKEVWARISVEKRKQWVQSDKDPIMSISWDIYKYLKDNFFGVEFNE